MIDVARSRSSRPAAARLPVHGARRAAAGQAGALDPGPGRRRRLAHRDGRRRQRADRRGAALPAEDTATGSTLFTWIPAGDFQVDVGVLRRQPDRLPADRRHDDRPARPRLLDRLHEPRPGLLAVLRLPEPVHVLDAPARPGGQLARRVRGLGAGRPVELPADRLLVPQALGGAGGQEGVHRQPRRRRRLRARDHGDLRQHEPPGATLNIRESIESLLRQGDADDPDHRHRAARVRRRHGQERPVPAPRLAAGRDGGPDPGVGPDPRRDDGQRRRLPRRPGEPALRLRARRDGRRRRRSASSPPSSPRRSR